MSDVPSVSSSHLEPTDAIGLVTIDRPPVNALPTSAWREMTESIERLAASDDVRVIIITGGEQRFCAGADISELIDLDSQDDPATMLTAVNETTAAIRAARVPVIAAVRGPAMGGGLGLALSCDIRVASPDATFAAAGVNMGVLATVWPLVNAIGDTAARRMLLTGDVIDAETALEWGLVTQLVEDPLATATEIASTISAKPPLAVSASKQALNELSNATAADSLELVTELFRELRGSNDHREALDAFRNKRPAEFKRN